MKKFAVIGNPIAHSKSPDIHSAFAEQFDISLDYQKRLTPPDQFEAHTREFFESATGANVTVPFKTAALEFSDTLSEDAILAGAVNTLSRQEDDKGVYIKGDNTDGIGLVRDIQENHHFRIDAKRVLILGAGGAAKGVILPIAKAQPASITIANRTHSKAVAIAERFATHAPITAASLTALNTPFDLIINATSASLSQQSLALDKRLFKADSVAYDMMYGSAPTPFMQFAAQKGATAIDGLGMLVEQAAESFRIWHSVSPDTHPVIDDIRTRLRSAP